jgi:putative component of toxin-antitoxin plasmid stabilization module
MARHPDSSKFEKIYCNVLKEKEKKEKKKEKIVEVHLGQAGDFSCVGVLNVVLFKTS